MVFNRAFFLPTNVLPRARAFFIVHSAILPFLCIAMRLLRDYLVCQWFVESKVSASKRYVNAINSQVND